MLPKFNDVTVQTWFYIIERELFVCWRRHQKHLESMLSTVHELLSVRVDHSACYVKLEEMTKSWTKPGMPSVNDTRIGELEG